MGSTEMYLFSNLGSGLGRHSVNLDSLPEFMSVSIAPGAALFGSIKNLHVSCDRYVLSLR